MAGYNDPQPPKDGWAKRLYGDNGLTDKSTMADIEPKARQLLSQPDTALTGAELTLGRRIDGGEKITNLFAMPGLDEEQKFALLLLQKAVEDGIPLIEPPTLPKLKQRPRKSRRTRQ